MVNGVNQSTFFILPMLGKHPDGYPRFRDCFVGNDEQPEYEKMIHVFTRVGGGNRESYDSDIELMRSDEHYVADFDDDFDSTYATFVFSVPKKWKKDFDLILDGKLLGVSKEYQEELRRIYPKLNEKFDEIFNPGKEEA
jgi:hypothetical protein